MFATLVKAPYFQFGRVNIDPHRWKQGEVPMPALHGDDEVIAARWVNLKAKKPSKQAKGDEEKTSLLRSNAIKQMRAEKSDRIPLHSTMSNLAYSSREWESITAIED
jgi:hypothetical protein